MHCNIMAGHYLLSDFLFLPWLTGKAFGPRLYGISLLLMLILEGTGKTFFVCFSGLALSGKEHLQCLMLDD